MQYGQYNMGLMQYGLNTVPIWPWLTSDLIRIWSQVSRLLKVNILPKTAQRAPESQDSSNNNYVK